MSLVQSAHSRLLRDTAGWRGSTVGWITSWRTRRGFRTARAPEEICDSRVDLIDALHLERPPVVTAALTPRVQGHIIVLVDGEHRPDFLQSPERTSPLYSGDARSS